MFLELTKHLLNKYHCPFSYMNAMTLFYILTQSDTFRKNRSSSQSCQHSNSKDVLRYN
jgi:hypothetical protein